MATIAEQSSELRMATFRLARRLRAEKTDEALCDGQFAVLGGLFLHGPHTLSELADRERVSAPSMNRTVNCLQESGYLQRVADESTDARSSSPDRRRPRGRRRDPRRARRLAQRGTAELTPRSAAMLAARRRDHAEDRDPVSAMFRSFSGLQLPRLVHRRARLEHRRLDAGDRPELGRAHRTHRQRRRSRWASRWRCSSRRRCCSSASPAGSPTGSSAASC